MTSAQRFLSASRFYLNTEYRAKLHAAVSALPADRLWWRPNDESNSVGNLLLHLAGNIGEWIVSGVGGAPNSRRRADEFAARSGQGPAELLALLDKALDNADAALARLTDADLDAPRMIQGRETTVLEAVYHVVEHSRCTWDRSSSSQRCTRPARSSSMKTPADWRNQPGATPRASADAAAFYLPASSTCRVSVTASTRGRANGTTKYRSAAQTGNRSR